MPIRVKCEKCKKTLSVKDHLAGKKIKCPLCQGVVAVPAASSASDPPKPGTPAPAKKPGLAAKKPAAGTKPAVKSKPAAGKPETNGTPASNGEKTNGKAHPPAPAPVELPPANVEEEALAALADEPPPPEETQAPQTIDFKCSWCDEEVKLPIELGGKQAQCPNPECKRIIKVPMPKAPEKKDWRKMDRRGPAAAAINQPEALENAWGTEEATQARQGSLAQAGIGVPEKPPIGVMGWVVRGLKGLLLLALLVGIGVGGYKLRGKSVEHRTLEDIERHLKGPNKLTNPIQLAEAYRAIEMYYLHGRDPKAAEAATKFTGALSYINTGDEPPPADAPMLNEQFLLIDLALTHVESGGKPDADIVRYEKKRQDWSKTQDEIKTALLKIKTPEIQVIAVRELAFRLYQKDDKDKEMLAIAVALAGSFRAEDPITKKRPLAYRQYIAQMYWADQIDKLEPKVEEPKLAELKELDESDIRVGFAEGYARKAKYEDALKLAAFPGPEWDRLDAHIGVASVAWQNKNKEVAADALAKAMTIADKADAKPWHWFELGRLAARLDDKEAVKKCIDKVPPPFKVRVQLEVVLAQCDRSATKPVERVILDDLEAATENDRITLALGWTAVARQQARTGANSLKIFDQYKALGNLKAEDYDLIRPMVEIGSFQGTLSK